MTEFPPPHVDFRTNILIGDAGGGMFDHSKGGDDTFIGGVDPANNTMYGDAVANMSEHAQGGNDTFSFPFSLPPGGIGGLG